jgi:hypothetical protein
VAEESGNGRETGEPPEGDSQFHVAERMEEVEPVLGKRGKWVYVGWVALWVVVLAVILVAYAFLNSK